jgi:translation initiation factor 2 beta subunit (eIF-2beta)/eIF-5
MENFEGKSEKESRQEMPPPEVIQLNDDQVIEIFKNPQAMEEKGLSLAQQLSRAAVAMERINNDPELFKRVQRELGVEGKLAEKRKKREENKP